MVSVQFLQVCKVYGDNQENIIVLTPANKELLTLDFLRIFFIGISVKYYSFCKITHSLISAGNNNMPSDFIWIGFLCMIKEGDDIFVNFILDKPTPSQLITSISTGQFFQVGSKILGNHHPFCWRYTPAVIIHQVLLVGEYQ